MGMVFQSYSIWPHMTVGENISLGLRAKGVNQADIGSLVEQALELVRLPGLCDRPATDLSGGQQQRVAVARSIVLEPEILLFDEPLSNLDANLRDEMRFELHDLLRRLGIMSIYVTHDQTEAFVISDRICIMQSGRVVQSGTPEEIYCRPATRFVAEFIGMANVLPAVVASIENRWVVARLEDGQTIHAAGSNVVCRAGEQVDLCIRSECAELLPQTVEAQPSNGFQGRIVQRAYLGGTVEYRLAAGPNLLRINVSPSIDFEVGEAVWIQVPPADVLVVRANQRQTS
jgi:ABC-type Fe3+/spermidine/putrescine transport system ATPase subunit